MMQSARLSSMMACRASRVAVGPAVQSTIAGQRHFASLFPGISDSSSFVSEPTLNKDAGAIPIFRIIDEQGKVVPGAELPFSHDEAKGMFKTMVRVSVVDQILNSLQRQGRISFYMTGLGEEAAQVGSAAGLDASDVVWPQYRELGCFMHRGFTIQQVLDQCMSRKDEPGKGRQMPVHYCDVNINMQAVTSPLTTQIPQAAGAGYAFRTEGQDRCAVAYCGDGAASEGDFAAGLNFAATLNAQTIFLVRNNGWAISTEVREQYRGDGIAVRGIAYGMNSIRVDGNDLAAVYQGVKMARKHCVENKEPALVEMMTYRRGHHSTSDDATRYRGESVKGQAGLEPIGRMRLLLEAAGCWTEAEEKALRDDTKEEIMNALKTSEAKQFAAVSDMFEDVWATPPQHLVKQREELYEHLKRHRDQYPSLEKFVGN